MDQEFTLSEVATLVLNIANEYGVNTDDVAAEINYEVTGSFTVENADPSQADAIKQIIKDSISQQTGVPVSDIDVSYNNDTGEVRYSVQTESYDDSSGIKEDIKADLFTNTIKSILEKVDSNIDVISPTVDDAVVADIDIVVDATDAVADINNATNYLSTKLADDGFRVERSKGKWYFRMFL